MILGDSFTNLVSLLIDRLESEDAKDLIKIKFQHGDSALHVTTQIHYVHIMRKLIQFEPQLCYFVNDNEETPLCRVAKLGHLEVVKELIKWKPDAVKIVDSCGMNVLHLASQVSQVQIVDYLNKKVGLSDLVNKGLDKLLEEKPLQSGESIDQTRKRDHFLNICEVDTPLHIAARNKKLPISFLSFESCAFSSHASYGLFK